MDIGRLFTRTWGCGAAIGAASGFLAPPVRRIYPDMGSQFILKAFAAAVLGGFDSVLGAIIGGFLMGAVELLAGGFISTSLIDVASYLRSEEHTSELQSLMRISYAVFCLKKKKRKHTKQTTR